MIVVNINLTRPQPQPRSEDMRAVCEAERSATVPPVLFSIVVEDRVSESLRRLHREWWAEELRRVVMR